MKNKRKPPIIRRGVVQAPYRADAYGFLQGAYTGYALSYGKMDGSDIGDFGGESALPDKKETR